MALCLTAELFIASKGRNPHLGKPVPHERMGPLFHRSPMPWLLDVAGEVMANFMKAYGWGWQRISQKSPLRRVLHNAKQALENKGQDQIIVW